MLNKKHEKHAKLIWLIRFFVIIVLIMPIFLIEGKNKSEKIDSMPEIYRKTPDKQLEDIKSAAKLGINAIIIFPAIKEKLKDPFGKEALNKKTDLK